MSETRPEGQRLPDGWAWRYADGIRFNNGQSVNGGYPLESIPYWLEEPPTSPPSDSLRERWKKYREEKCPHTGGEMIRLSRPWSRWGCDECALEFVQSERANWEHELKEQNVFSPEDKYIQSELAPLCESARKLLAECKGILGMEEMELRQLLSNTNIAVWKLRMDELQAALDGMEKP